MSHEAWLAAYQKMVGEDRRKVGCYPENQTKKLAEFDSIFAEAMKDAQDGEFTDSPEELDARRSCLINYLMDYVDFASAEKLSDEQIEKLYQKTLTMSEGAIHARDAQKNNVRDQERILEEMLWDSGFEWDNNFNVTKAEENPPSDAMVDLGRLKSADTVKRELDKDKKFLINLRSKHCLPRNKTDELSRTRKVVCIEEFAHSSHSRGPYLSTGCGFILPEEIVEMERDFMSLEDLGLPAADLAQAVFSCLAAKEFNPKLEINSWEVARE
jgi:hypothetical protein